MQKMALARVEYVGKKPFQTDRVTGSGVVWHGPGDVQPMDAEKAQKLEKLHPDQWKIVEYVDHADPEKNDAIQELKALAGEEGLAALLERPANEDAAAAAQAKRAIAEARTPKKAAEPKAPKIRGAKKAADEKAPEQPAEKAPEQPAAGDDESFGD